MIDGIKVFNLSVPSNKLLENPLLADYWHTNVKNTDGEIKKEFAEYFGLRFTVKNRNVRLQGSIHKYKNHGKHNYDDFTSHEVKNVLTELSEHFSINLYRSELNNLEFGVNVELPFSPKLILDNIVCYKGDPFSIQIEEGKSFYQCQKRQFIIKIYDKGKQYRLQKNVLRFEIKVVKKQYFEWSKIRIKCLSDLLNHEIYPQLGYVLASTFNDILFTDGRVATDRMCESDRLIFHQCSDLHTWTIKPKSSKEKKERQRLRSKFEEVLKRYLTGIDFKAETLKKIKDKVTELSLSYRPESVVEASDLSLSYQVSEAQKVSLSYRPESVVEASDLSLSYQVPEVQKVSLSYRKSEPFYGVYKKQLQNDFVPFLHFRYSVRKGQCLNVTDFTSPHIKLYQKTLCSGCGKPLEDGQITYHSDECRRRKYLRNKSSNKRMLQRRKYGNVDTVMYMFLEQPALLE